MISNNLFYKIDPVNSENFQKLIESNIDFIKYGGEKASSFLESKQKARANSNIKFNFQNPTNKLDSSMSKSKKETKKIN